MPQMSPFQSLRATQLMRNFKNMGQSSEFDLGGQMKLEQSLLCELITKKGSKINNRLLLRFIVMQHKKFSHLFYIDVIKVSMKTNTKVFSKTNLHQQRQLICLNLLFKFGLNFNLIIIWQYYMTDSFTMPELKVILDHRINTNAESAEHLYKFNDREYVILPKVFSPAYFPNTHWFTHTFLMNMPTCSSFLEIGTGAGNVLIEAILSGKVKDIAMGTDINKIAIDNAQINLKKFGVVADLVVSDVLDGISKEKKFDLIYWNYPFHFNFNKAYGTMDEIEISLRDPEYVHLQKLLKTAKAALLLNGRIIISFSYKLGNLERLREIVELYGWKENVLAIRTEDLAQNMPELCLLELTPI